MPTLRGMEHERKTANSFVLKAEDGADGQFTAVFSTLNAVDHDGDVTLPGAFEDGKEVLISAYGHQSWYGSMPIGKGVIHADEEKAWVDGQFLLNTTHGKDAYTTIKEIGGMQEWSYGFDVKESAYGDFAGQKVRFLKAVDVFEVSPVLRGAGVGTHLQIIKGRTMEEESDNALTAMADYLGRVRSLTDLRVKQGRTLSQANRDRLTRHRDVIAEIMADIEKLLEETDEPKDEPKAASGVAEFARFQLLSARRNGVKL